MITKNTYDIPYPEITLTDIDEVKEFFDETLLPFLAEKMGLVFRTDLSVMAPDYNTDSYVCFLAPSAEDDPYFSVNSYGVKQWSISPLRKNGNIFQPTSIYNQSSGGINNTWIYNEMIILQTINFTVNRSYLIVVDFDEGRKVCCFRTNRINDATIVEPNAQGSIYFGPIKINGDIVNTCVILAQGWNSAWLSDYDQRACLNVLTSRPKLSQSDYNSLIGILPTSQNIGKEYLIQLDYCISNEPSSLSYIPKVFIYSDFNNALESGSVVRIDGKKYLNVYKAAKSGATTYSKLLIPEEVN